MSQLEVVYRNVADLLPYARNSRTHSDEQVAQIAGSIREFGFVNPVLIDGENGIIAGHGRILAARKLGMAEVPTIRLAPRSRLPSSEVVVEEWRSIPGAEAYEVSSLGRVRRVKPARGTKVGRIINPVVDAGGRAVFNVRDKAVRQMKLHRAVALAFHGPQPKGCEVAHLDGDQLNNRADNLKWATPVENNGHKVIHGTQPMGETVYNAKLTEEGVRWARSVKSHRSYTEIPRHLGVSQGRVVAAVMGKTWKHVQ